jgi:hypothetical protein
LNAYQAITRLRKIRGELIQSKYQESILFDYEKYPRSERPPPPSTKNNTDIK